jgi:hypothetical protein
LLKLCESKRTQSAKMQNFNRDNGEGLWSSKLTRGFDTFVYEYTLPRRSAQREGGLYEYLKDTRDVKS